LPLATGQRTTWRQRSRPGVRQAPGVTNGAEEVTAGCSSPEWDT
jgi:hypothetical protein